MRAKACLDPSNQTQNPVADRLVAFSSCGYTPQHFHPILAAYSCIVSLYEIMVVLMQDYQRLNIIMCFTYWMVIQLNQPVSAHLNSPIKRDSVSIISFMYWQVWSIGSHIPINVGQMFSILPTSSCLQRAAHPQILLSSLLPEQIKQSVKKTHIFFLNCTLFSFKDICFKTAIVENK